MTDTAFSGFDGDTQPGNLPQTANDKLPVSAQELRPASLISPRETLDFQLRAPDGGSNALLELAMPILGLAVRIRDMPNFSDIESLHSRLTSEIQNFQKEAEAIGYDDATTVAARYCLCAMVDESVLSQTWGAESLWPERPMLSVFHNETWGGEKVFGILDRVIEESHRFTDLLEFQYFCIALGFEGKYHVMHNGQARLDHLLGAVYKALEKHQGEAPTQLVDPTPNIYGQKQRMGWRVPVWTVFAAGLVSIVAIHLWYDFTLTERINEIAAEIGTSLGVQEESE
ncbi:type IVB secretion system protein IcmH/DotU [Halocynthiibacter namhaensis]|uniref:type IVB secretion system protein IcmH/DotU n=1 Tax=Halocynthiibacter namhaensis TaxID=1290553 RepID=UPI00068E008D|nr:type IVB secretion system protein IcmH/DotU [Halocynthiibacter namhaensis]